MSLPITLFEREQMTSWRAGAWVVLIACASIAFSRAFACATPFAALATIAALKMGARNAVLTVLVAWIVNQAIGLLILGYPHTATTFAWGGAIGVAAIASVLAARQILLLTIPTMMRFALAFIGAYAMYEAVLIATAFVLQSGFSVFAPSIVLRIFAINAVALVLLLTLHHLLLSAAKSIDRMMASRSPSWT